MGYLMALLIESLISFSLSIIGALPICFFSGLCWILTAFVHDIASDVIYLPDDKGSKRNPIQIKSNFRKIIREILHIEGLSICLLAHL